MTAARSRSGRPEPSEAEWQSVLVDLARLGGWRIYHPLPARIGDRVATWAIGDAGFPDLVLAHPRRGFLVVEVKTTRGRLGPEQVEWIDTLTAAGVDVRVWRPADLDEARRTLVGRHRPRPVGGAS